MAFSAVNAMFNRRRNHRLAGVLSLTVGSGSPPPPPDAPDAPSVPGDTVTTNGVSFVATWQATARASNYRIDVSLVSNFATFVLQDFSVGNAVSYEVTGTTPETTYYYRVRAQNVTGTSASSSVITVDSGTEAPAIPDAPVATAASSVLSSTFSANWNASSGTTSYRLDVSTVSNFATFVSGFHDLNVGNVTTYGVTGLSADTDYFYRLRAVNAAGTSGNSNTISVTSGAAPSVPDAPVATAGDDNLEDSFSANWNASADTTSYRLDVATDSGFTSFVTGFNDLNVGNVLTYSVPGLSPDATYYYRVRAVNVTGASSNSDTITTGTVPEGPGVDVASDILTDSFSANWGGTAGADGYKLDVATDSGFTSFVTGFNNLDVGNVFTYSVTGLTPGTAYHYRLRAYNSIGSSVSSDTVDVTTASGGFLPTDVPDLMFALESTSLSGLADGADVTSWVDPYNGANSATPLLLAPKKQTVNGVPVCRFAGSDRLVTNSFLDSSYDTAFTIITVKRPTDDGFLLSTSNQGVKFFSYIRSARFASGCYANDLSTQYLDFPITAFLETARAHGQTYDGAHRKSYLNRQKNSLSDAETGNLGLSGTLTIGDLSSGGFPFLGDIAAIYIFKRAITASEMDAMMEYVGDKFVGYAGVGLGYLVTEGDSMTVGNTAPNNYPARVAARLTTASVPYLAVYNSGVGGQKITDMLADDYTLTQYISPLRERDVAFFWIGGNDILADEPTMTLADLKQRARDLVATVRAAGLRSLIALTVLPRTSLTGSKETMRVAYNSWLVANGEGLFDAVCNVAADTNLDDPTDGTYFADGTHLTDAGYLLVGDLVFDTLTAYLASL
jgi:phosphodiesterase/alkaline phosphatase D-like protein/lysophospholipase L1-like esterase